MLIKEIKLLHDENKQLKKLVEQGNNDIYKLKSNLSNLESKLINTDRKIDEVKEQILMPK